VSETKIAVPFAANSPDPEVPAKPVRRMFNAEDQKRILEELDRAPGHGGIGAVLRREGIYSSTLHGWRKERDAAVRQAFSQKRGPQPRRNPLTERTRSCAVRISGYRKIWRRQTVVDPIFWTEKRPFLRWSAALKMKESQCLKPARVTRPA